MEMQTSIAFELAEPRITNQTQMVLVLLADRRWWTPAEICEEVWRTRGIRMSDSGCTARLRDARKEQFGGHKISIRRRNGTKAYEYRLED